MRASLTTGKVDVAEQERTEQLELPYPTPRLTNETYWGYS